MDNYDWTHGANIIVPAPGSDRARIEALEKRVEQLEKAFPEEIVMPNGDLDYTVEINGTRITLPLSKHELLVTEFNDAKSHNDILRRQLETEKIATKSARDEVARLKKKLRNAYDSLASTVDEFDEFDISGVEW